MQRCASGAICWVSGWFGKWTSLGMIELLHFHSHPDKPRWTGTPCSTGFTHVALTVENIDVLCTKLRAEGVTFFAPPQHSPDRKVKVTYCRGPEGVLLELVEILPE
jgi:catechol 2,3-dioxygenase-like lactoylglutathione lyase family enzyme